MRLLLLLLSAATLTDCRASTAGRGASAARGASTSRGASASSASRGSSSSSAARPPQTYSYTAPRNVYTPPRTVSNSRSSFGGVSPFLAFGTGALAGAVTANHINNAYAPISYGGNNYYWTRNAVPANSPIVCSRPIEDVDNPDIEGLEFDDGSSPTEFAWPCSSSQRCCGWSCCADKYANRTDRSSSNSASSESEDDSPLLPLLTLLEDSTNRAYQTNFMDYDVPVAKKNNDNSVAGWIILGVVATIVLLAILAVAIMTVRKRKRRDCGNAQSSVSTQDEAWSPELPSNRLRSATPAAAAANRPPPPLYSYAPPIAPKSTLPADKPPSYTEK